MKKNEKHNPYPSHTQAFKFSVCKKWIKLCYFEEKMGTEKNQTELDRKSNFACFCGMIFAFFTEFGHFSCDLCFKVSLNISFTLS